MVVADAVIRKLPGALGHAESAVEESFSEALEGMPEYPHYTRPPDLPGLGVPEILLSGDHGGCASGGSSRAARAAPRSLERGRPSRYHSANRAVPHGSARFFLAR